MKFWLLSVSEFPHLQVVGSLVPLGLICLIVTLGNLLVITAVKISSKLSGPTYTIIVSLAVADLLLGILVLPLSAVYEVIMLLLLVEKSQIHPVSNRWWTAGYSGSISASCGSRWTCGPAPPASSTW